MERVSVCPTEMVPAAGCPRYWPVDIEWLSSRQPSWFFVQLTADGGWVRRVVNCRLIYIYIYIDTHVELYIWWQDCKGPNLWNFGKVGGNNLLWLWLVTGEVLSVDVSLYMGTVIYGRGWLTVEDESSTVDLYIGRASRQLLTYIWELLYMGVVDILRCPVARFVLPGDTKWCKYSLTSELRNSIYLVVATSKFWCTM